MINSTTAIQTTLTGLAVDASGKAACHCSVRQKSYKYCLVLENIKDLKKQELQDPSDAAKGVGIMILPPDAITTAIIEEPATTSKL